MKQSGMILMTCLLILMLTSLMLIEHLQTLILAQRRDSLFLKAQEHYYSGLLILKNLPSHRLSKKCLSDGPIRILDLIHRSVHCKGSTQNNLAWHYFHEKLDQDSHRGTVYYFVLPNKIWMAQMYWRKQGKKRRIKGWFETIAVMPAQAGVHP